jgi:hypothetical protein
MAAYCQVLLEFRTHNVGQFAAYDGVSNGPR